MFGMGMTELLLVAMVAMLFFGANRLPELARSLGKAVNEFKRGKDEMLGEIVNARVVKSPEVGSRVSGSGSRVKSGSGSESESGSNCL